MNKKAFGVFISLLAVAMLMLPMSAAYAKKPTTVTWISAKVPPAGSYIYNQAGKSDNWIMTTQGGGWSWVGDITGSGTYDGRWVIHDVVSMVNYGAVNVLGTYTMDVTYDGKSGTLTVRAGGGGGNAMWRILSGTGDLENLRGHGTLEKIVAGVYIFTGQVHFDPN